MDFKFKLKMVSCVTSFLIFWEDSFWLKNMFDLICLSLSFIGEKYYILVLDNIEGIWAYPYG